MNTSTVIAALVAAAFAIGVLIRLLTRLIEPATTTRPHEEQHARRPR